MLWLIATFASLSAEQKVNLLWAVLHLALAAGLNARMGALLAACLALVMVFT
jgi:hypothetical protein